jgi:hypothetical protein
MANSSFSIPLTQNTARVIEFRCLFTHDIQKKKKKWKDGVLKYHTFNRRVMVYDEVLNYVGDSHWQSAEPVKEGDELALQNGSLVEVSEAFRTSETDLTPLFEKRQKATAERVERRELTQTRIGSTADSQKHKSLSALLGPSRGFIGKAVPLQSPFDAKHDRDNQEIEGQEPTPKKRKTTSGSSIGPWKVVSTTKARNVAPSPARQRLPTVAAQPRKPVSKKSKEQYHPGQTKLRIHQVIDLLSSESTDPLESNGVEDSTASMPRQSPPPVDAGNQIYNVADALASSRALAKDEYPRQRAARSGLEQSSSTVGITRDMQRMVRSRDIRSQGAKVSRKKDQNISASLANAEAVQTVTTPWDGSSPARRKQTSPRERNPRAKPLRLKTKPKPKLLCMQDGSMEITTTRPSGDSAPAMLRGHTGRTSNNPQSFPIAEKGPSSTGVEPLLPSPSPAMRLREPAQVESPPRLSQTFNGMELAEELLDDALFAAFESEAPAIETTPSPVRPFRRVQSDPEPRDTTYIISPGQAAAAAAAAAGPSRRQPLRKTQSVVSAMRPVPNERMNTLPTFKQPAKPVLRETKSTDVGPWSTDALDLFDWRPPDWEDRLQRIPASVAMVD